MEVGTRPLPPPAAAGSLPFPAKLQMLAFMACKINVRACAGGDKKGQQGQQEEDREEGQVRRKRGVQTLLGRLREYILLHVVARHSGTEGQGSIQEADARKGRSGARSAPGRPGW